MNQDFIQKLQYSYAERNESCSLPYALQDSLQIISNFRASNSGNKLCLVFPSKEYATQWLSIPLVLNQIMDDFYLHRSDITDSYKSFKTGDKLLLNNEAVVEWVRLNSLEKKGVVKQAALIRTKSTKGSASLEIAIPFKKIIKLQRTNRKILSSQKTVMSVLPKNNTAPLENLLGIETFGNEEFIRTKVCLVTKYKSFDESIDNVLLNSTPLPDYLTPGKINENGTPDTNGPFLLTNNLSNLALYSIANLVTTIIIDGTSPIIERGTDFSDIDVKRISTILVTDLSEIDNFEIIGNYGFEFFHFTKENLNLQSQINISPFQSFETKLKKYAHFNLTKELCNERYLEDTIYKIHSIENDDFDQDLSTLKINLVHIVNIVSRICHVISADEKSLLNQKLISVDALFQKSKAWLGDSQQNIKDSISLLRLMVERFASEPSEKCLRLKAIMAKKTFDYIICPTEEEVQSLRNQLHASTRPKIISMADVNDGLPVRESASAIITGWPKTNNVNRLLFSFLFSDVTFIFYQFENKYYNSLQRRNKIRFESIKPTIGFDGSPSKNLIGLKAPDDLHLEDDGNKTPAEGSVDILELELRLENSQYSKYSAKGNPVESIKAKRVEFEANLFLYSTESHKFLVINELIEKNSYAAKLHRKKLDAIKSGDVIVLINTDKDILAELVKKNTNKGDLQAVTQWTDLWKKLLKDYFVSIGSDFKKLVDDLRANDCKKHETTIRTWLQDINLIGPDDDSDLISIALLTNSNLLNDNVKTVREAIRKMTGWRIKAAEFISDRIKAEMHELADSSIINKKISIDGLGSAIVLKIIEISSAWENIDVRYVNRPIPKETI